MTSAFLAIGGILFFTFILHTSEFIAEASTCTTYSGINYCKTSSQGSQSESQSSCSAGGGNLATVPDAGHKDALSDLADGDKVWIGLIKSGSTWVWSDGTPFEYENWKSQGNQKSWKDCVIMKGDGKWEAQSCEDNKYAICQGITKER